MVFTEIGKGFALAEERLPGPPTALVDGLEDWNAPAGPIRPGWSIPVRQPVP